MTPHRPNWILRGQPARLVLALAMVLAGAQFGLQAGPWTTGPKFEGEGEFLLWDSTVTGSVMAGFKDNALLSHVDRQSTPVVGLAAEWFLLRIPADGNSVTLFFRGEDLRYVDHPRVSTNDSGATKEQSFITQVTGRHALGRGWSVGLTGQHLFNDQVIDASEVGGLPGTIQAQGHTLSLTPSLRWEPSRRASVEASLVGTRQYFRAPISSYWQWGPKLATSWSYATNSGVEVTLSQFDRPYDDRLLTDLLGGPISGTSASIEDYRSEVVWRHTLDRAGHWQTTARFLFSRRYENGQGYSDYDRIGGGFGLRYTSRRWTVRGLGRWSTYDYPSQIVSRTRIDELRRRDEIEVEGRVEFRVSAVTRLFASYEYEKSRSNVPEDNYQAQSVLLGIERDF